MSAPIVIVTRAQPGCAETARALEAMGYRAIESPAIELKTVEPAPEILLDGVQGLVFTSANGVRAFTARSDRRDLMAWCVGPATVQAARDAGFPRTANADGNAEDLARLMIRDADPGAGAFVHIANTAAAGALVRTLNAAGLVADFAGLYEPLNAEAFSQSAQQMLEQGMAEAVLFHSAKGATAFQRLAEALPLDALANTVAVGVSANAVEAIRGRGWREIVVAQRPNEAALLSALSTTISSV